MTKKALQRQSEKNLLKKVEEDVKKWPKWFLANAELVLETGSSVNFESKKSKESKTVKKTVLA
jgi:hypothetical protein